MHVLFLFGFLTFFFELLILPHTKNRLVRCLPLIGMELFPVIGIAYYAMNWPSSLIWSWKDNLIFCLWIARAILIGWILAMIVYKAKRD